MNWPKVPWNKLGKSVLLLFLFLVLALSAGLWYLSTDSFQQAARRKLIAELERATGGRVQVGTFHVVPLRLQVDIRDLTIRGQEAAGERPLLHVDRVAAVLSFSSALGAKLGFHSLTLEHPVLHVIVYPNGTTNQPAPSRQGSSDFEHLFSLSARRLQVKEGELLVQDQRIPISFSTNDVSASLNYSFLHLRYAGTIAVGRAETRIDVLRPVAWSAQANFNFDRSGVQINSLQATSERSQVHLTDLHLDLQKLAANGKYDVNVDLAQLAAITHRPELKGGTLRVIGDGSWSRQGFSSAGSFGGRSISWQDSTLRGRDFSAEGNFSLDPSRFSLSKVEGQFLRGTFSADGDVVNWQSPVTFTKSLEQQGALKIRAKNISLSELLASLRPRFHGANELRFGGNLSATADLRWRRSVHFAQAAINAEVSPPARLSGDQIPLTAATTMTFDARSGDLQVAQMSASTPATQVRASGSLSNSMRLAFSTTDLGEWRPIVSDLFPRGAPFAVHGRAAFNGTVSGTPPDMRVAGSLQLQDFSAFVRATAHAPRQEVRWDSVNTELQASSTNLFFRNAVLKREAATVKANGAIGLTDWQVVPESPLRLHIDIENADSRELANLAGYGYGISGQLSARLSISGTRQLPQGRGDFNMLHAGIEGQQFDSASGSLTLNRTQLEITNLQLAHGNARIGGAGSYDLSSKAFQFNIRGSEFNLADFSQLHQSQIKIAGKLDFAARVFGTTVQPQVAADLQLRSLSVNDQPEGNFLLNVTSRGADARIVGRSDFKDAELQLEGNVRLRDQWPAHVNLHFSHLNADPFLHSYPRGAVIKHSAVAGALTLDGPLRKPRELSLAGDLSDVYAEAGKTSFRNDGPIRFALSGKGFKVDNLHILGENTDFSGNGSMQFAGDRALDFRASGRVDLKLIQSYDTDITSSGALLADGRVTGTIDSPIVKGKLQIQNAALADINVPSALSDINGTLLFSQNQVTIDSLEARVGGGNVGFTGHAALVGRQLDFDLNATANSVRLRYPPGVSSTADAQFHWSGSSAGSVLSGDITVNKLGFTPGFDFGAYLERTAEVSSLPQTDPVLNTIRLDLHVTTTPELQMQTSVVRLQGSADLRVRGSAAKPILLGRADVFEGQAYFNGTKYRLERGGVTFSNPAVTTPFLDLEAVTRVRDYDVTLSLTGDISKPNGLKINYRSDPPLPSSDIIALLAFGQTTEESAQLQQTNQSAFSQQASNAMLAAALNATLNNRAQHLFGNSRIKIDPQGLESETSTVTQSGPAVTIEQQVKDNLTLSYTTDVSQTSQQVIRAEYNVSRNVSIVAIRDQNGVVSFDVRIRRRKR
ncbi:MAG TPA: translocation/assembly module TamB domain-containing protein [Terriglobales bacterium]|nr:translocation/assembly module TamB domain-containing protein [Terriglobales bacterium]